MGLRKMSPIWSKVTRLASRVRPCRHFLRTRLAQQVAIVMYHGVIDQPLPVFNWCQMELSRFQEQIQWLASNCRVLPLREIAGRLARGLSLPDNTVAITFDDGFKNVYTTAYPVLQRYRTPFTVYLITSLVGTRQLTWPEQFFNALLTAGVNEVQFEGGVWPLRTAAQKRKAYADISSSLKSMETSRKDASLSQLLSRLNSSPGIAPALTLMDWEEVHRLAKGGLADFGSHTHAHPILSRCDPARQRRELCQSREILLQQFGNADLFAYPNGTRRDFNHVTKSLLQELGYSCAVTTIPGLNRAGADLYELRRVNVGADADLAAFEILMLGL